MDVIKVEISLEGSLGPKGYFLVTDEELREQDGENDETIYSLGAQVFELLKLLRSGT